MGLHVRDDIGPDHDPVWVDDVGDAPGEVGVLLVGTLLGLVRLTDRPVGVAQQAEREALRLGEGELLLGCVERNAEDLGAGLGELGGSITEPLAFDRSAGRGRLGVPPQDDPAAGDVAERHAVGVLVEQ